MAKSWIIRLSAGYGFLPVASEIAAVDPVLGGNIGVEDKMTEMMGNEPDASNCWKAITLDSDYLLVFHHPKHPKIKNLEKARLDCYNPMASGLANSRVMGIAVVVKAGEEGYPCALNDAEVEAVMPILSRLFDKYCRVDPGPYVAANLCFVEEIDPGRGFAYFSVGAVPPDFFIGWDLAPAVQYAEPPRTCNGCTIVTVVYDCPDLVLPDNVKSWSGWSAEAINEGKCHWLESRDGSVKLGHLTSIADFVKAVRDLGGIVYIEEKAEKGEKSE